MVATVITIVVVLVCLRNRSRRYSPSEAEQRSGVTVTELPDTPIVQLHGLKDEKMLPKMEQEGGADLDIDDTEAKPSL